MEEFLDYVPSPTWVGSTWIWDLNTTRNGGDSFEIEVHRMVFGVYFFLSEDKVESFKNLANIKDVIAIMEGLASLVIMFMAVVPTYINSKQLEAKTIRYCYYDIERNLRINPNDDIAPAKPMKFNCCDKLSTF